jgi:hypothetical protein
MKLIILLLLMGFLTGQVLASEHQRKTLSASAVAQKSLEGQHRHGKRSVKKRRGQMTRHASGKEVTGVPSTDLRTPPINEPLEPAIDAGRPAKITKPPITPTPQSPRSKRRGKKRRLQPLKIPPDILP